MLLWELLWNIYFLTYSLHSNSKIKIKISLTKINRENNGEHFLILLSCWKTRFITLNVFFPIACSHSIKLLDFTSCFLQKREGSVCFSFIYDYILRWRTPIIHSSYVHTKTSHKTKKHFSLKGNLLYVRKKFVQKQEGVKLQTKWFETE